VAVGELSYVNFDLRLHRGHDGDRSYVADVIAPEARRSVEFHMPFSDAEFADLRWVVAGPARDGADESPRRDAGAQYRAKLKLFGERLYETIFNAEVRNCMTVSLREAQRNGQGLRIRICLDNVPQLADLPWEYLYDRRDRSYLATN